MSCLVFFVEHLPELYHIYNPYTGEILMNHAIKGNYSLDFGLFTTDTC